MKTKKNIQWQNVTPSRNRTQASHSKSNTLLSTLTWHLLAPSRNRTQASHSKSNTLLSTLTWHLLVRLRLSLYSHALLIPLKSSKSKYQVVHEQKFKDWSQNDKVWINDNKEARCLYFFFQLQFSLTFIKSEYSNQAEFWNSRNSSRVIRSNWIVCENCNRGFHIRTEIPMLAFSSLLHENKKFRSE